MLASLVLLTLAPAAPVEVTARPTPYPSKFLGGQPAAPTIDTGMFIEVTIKNTSQEALSFDSRHELGDLVLAVRELVIFEHQNFAELVRLVLRQFFLGERTPGDRRFGRRLGWRCWSGRRCFRGRFGGRWRGI